VFVVVFSQRLSDYSFHCWIRRCRAVETHMNESGHCAEREVRPILQHFSCAFIFCSEGWLRSSILSSLRESSALFFVGISCYILHVLEELRHSRFCSFPHSYGFRNTLDIPLLVSLSTSPWDISLKLLDMHIYYRNLVEVLPKFSSLNIGIRRRAC
jgi:hypothetical protein